ncbi:hypothetical protein Ae406Ps2_2067c [Pseudonocardia sp. Ae406_Ps2]|nr:hypothetical protein Ae406Ps2_2065c [Pseudonocardia sp. Ae406_Ps2]OLM02067.1 hypothetical protein Ae406Ps2_2067c [Pseudonocardia sp. Ae406_Ps2]OLM06150.1 hypothetical protein Ae331Ps2_3860 [Pseudonocardia sp. Ae331_Ps2]
MPDMGTADRKHRVMLPREGLRALAAPLVGVDHNSAIRGDCERRCEAEDVDDDRDVAPWTERIGARWPPVQTQRVRALAMRIVDPGHVGDSRGTTVQLLRST